MKLFGVRLPFTAREEKGLNAVPNGGGGWFPLVRESFGGAWQNNVTLSRNEITAFHAVFACVTLIASDIAKLPIKLVRKDDNGIWTETSNPAYSPVLRKPNQVQNRIQFIESWVLSKLLYGNAYILKKRDARGVVNGMYVLDPTRTYPLVSDDGEVFYNVSIDNVNGIRRQITVPATEIIHDRMNCIFNHQLVGVSPIYSCGLAASQGIKIQNNSSSFFENNSMPGGILSAKDAIDADTASRMKKQWEENFGGSNRGRVAIVGNDMKFVSMAMNAVDAQLIEQLKWTAEVVCSTFHVPPYKIGVGALPTYNNVQALNIMYYNDCLQRLIEDIEVCLDEGLGTGEYLGTFVDHENLLRMDSLSQMQELEIGTRTGIYTPNEARKKKDLMPKKGGDALYMQQQQFSLEALAKRDAKEDPFATSSPAPKPEPKPAAEPAPAPNGKDFRLVDDSRSAAIAAQILRSARSVRISSL